MIHVVAPDRCQMPEGASALASSFRWQIGGDQICAKGEDILGDSPCFRDSCQVRQVSRVRLERCSLLGRFRRSPHINQLRQKVTEERKWKLCVYF